MGSITQHPRADRASAEERVRELEGRVGEFMRTGNSRLLWDTMEELRMARQQLASVEFQESPLVAELRENRRPKARFSPGNNDEVNDVDRSPGVA